MPMFGENHSPQRSTYQYTMSCHGATSESLKEWWRRQDGQPGPDMPLPGWRWEAQLNWWWGEI